MATATSVAPSAAQGTVTINAAFLLEIKEVNQDLRIVVARIRRIAARHPLTRGECAQFCDLLCELRDELAMHFSLEEAFGYFDDPLVVSPRLSDRAGRLRREHGELYLEVSALADEAERCLSESRPGAFLTRIPRAFRRFYARYHAHERAENELILEAYGLDVGAGD